MAVRDILFFLNSQEYTVMRALVQSYPFKILVNVYGGAIESILTANVANWHGWCTAQDRKAIKTTQNITGAVCRA